MISEELMDKYSNMFEYAYAIVFKYYNSKSKRRRNVYKAMSMDLNDLRSIASIVVMGCIKHYVEKYEDIEKVRLKEQVKNRIKWKMSEIFRNNYNKAFLPHPEETEINKDSLLEYSINLYGGEKLDKTHLLFEEDIDNLFNLCCDNELEKKVMDLKINKGYTYKEIGLEIKTSRQYVNQIYSKVIKKIKKITDKEWK